jgi:sarcosine oxidase
MRVAVIGAGITGAAAAWALTRDGHDVRVLEQFELDHRRGSSHGCTRIFRLAYPEPQWVELARQALDGWRELERESGEQLLELDGFVEVAPTSEQSSRDILTAAGVRWEDIDAATYGIAVPDGWTALLQRDAGTVRSDRARDAFLRGLSVEAGVRVARLDDVDADAVVVAAGPWARPLLAEAGIELPVRATRETVAYFHYRPQVGAILERDEHGHLMYALRDPVHGLKAGSHMVGPEEDPDEPGVADGTAVETVTAWVAERFPGIDPEPVELDTCFYTRTGDESFVIERHGRIVVASPCSGHGFKFAPVTGRRVAALLA